MTYHFFSTILSCGVPVWAATSFFRSPMVSSSLRERKCSVRMEMFPGGVTEKPQASCNVQQRPLTAWSAASRLSSYLDSVMHTRVASVRCIRCRGATQSLLLAVEMQRSDTVSATCCRSVSSAQVYFYHYFAIFGSPSKWPRVPLPQTDTTI